VGARLVAATYAHYPHLPDRAFRLLVYMALVCKDDTPTPVYYGGREALATALGAAEDAAGYQVVRRCLSALVAYGAISRELAGYRGKRAEYRLNVRTVPGQRGALSEPHYGGQRESLSEPHSDRERESPSEPQTGRKGVTQRPPNSGERESLNDSLRGSLSEQNGSHSVNKRGSLSDPPRNNKEEEGTHQEPTTDLPRSPQESAADR
jgi:hypothetical protein